MVEVTLLAVTGMQKYAKITPADQPASRETGGDLVACLAVRSSKIVSETRPQFD